FGRARPTRPSARPNGRRVPIGATPADTLGETAEQCRKAGIDDRLCKPIRLAELEAVITAMLPEAGAPVLAADPPAAAAIVLDPAPLAAACGDNPVGRAELVALFLSSRARLLAKLRAARPEGRCPLAEGAG